MCCFFAAFSVSWTTLRLSGLLADRASSSKHCVGDV